MRHDIIEYAEVSPVIGRTVTVTVDRPLGSYHPEHKDMYYPKDAKEQGVLQIALEATDMGRPLYERYGFVKMEDEMELI